MEQCHPQAAGSPSASLTADSSPQPAHRARKILVLSRAQAGALMSSPGIRALNIARVLARSLPDARVTFGVPEVSDVVADAPFAVRRYRPGEVPALVREHDIIIAQGLPPTAIPALAGRRFVFDFFTNFLIEGLEYRREHVTLPVRHAWLEAQRTYLNLQLTMADFVLCANERQRDAWLGMMSSLGLITGHVYDRDNTLEKLVAVVPYGIRPHNPAAGRAGRPNGRGETAGGKPGADGARSEADDQEDVYVRGPGRGPVLKGVFPGVGPNDTVILWNGGILKWYDPVTLIRAVARIVPRRPDVKLLFLGTAYPVAGFDPGETVGEAYAAAREAGLLGTHVLFNDGWLPYDESGRYMTEADIGVSTYYDNLETHFSYRTRLVDFLWAGTPVVCTRGDVLADMVERRGLGITVPERDVDALEAALSRLLDDPEFRAHCRSNFAALQPELTWQSYLKPLIDFCRQDGTIARRRLWRTPDMVSHSAQYLAARARELTLVKLEKLGQAAGRAGRFQERARRMPTTELRRNEG